MADGLGTTGDDVGSILPRVYLPESDSVSLIYRLTAGHLWERRLNAEGDWGEPLEVTARKVVQSAVDSEQTGADAIAYAASVQVLFIEQSTGHLYHSQRRGVSDWTVAQRLIDNEQVQWVRGALVEQPGDSVVYGYVYDGGSNGGSGMNRYREIILAD